MINRIILGIFILVISLLGYAIIKAREFNAIPYEIVTIKTHHTLIQHEDILWQIPVYLSRQDHPLAYSEAYADLFISNQDETRKMWIDLDSLHYQGPTIDGSKIYHAYHLMVKIPYLGMDYHLESCYLTILLHNGERIVINLGSFSYLNVNDDSSADLDIVGLSGTKSNNDTISYLDTIIINLENTSNSPLHISAIVFGPWVDTNFHPLELAPKSAVELTISLYFDLLYYTPSVPVIIHYSVNNEQKTKAMESFLFYQHTHPLNENKAALSRHDLN